MKVIHEDSMKLYREFAENPPEAPLVPMKPKHTDPYVFKDRNPVAIIRADDRVEGIKEAISLLGGITPLIEGVEGDILIKPNCNTDDPYPRDTHPDTVRAIASILIEAGVSPDQVVVGDMSGRGRGLPTRATMENLGIKAVADEMALRIKYFEEEPWVTVKPNEATFWPKGLKIPKSIYDAERIIFTPILRSHNTATFTCSMKLGVGLIDAEERDWLHDGVDFYGKMMDINTAYQVDLVVSDALKMNTGLRTDPEDEVSPGVIIASNNMVAADAVSVALMRKYGTVRIKDKPTRMHTQFKDAERLGLGSSDLRRMDVVTMNLAGDPSFSDLVKFLQEELA
ncbi:MAG: DUF362 domain-containing protein [Candidatus Bathyarchaeota archaeon]|nr:DUF362 domain-containing protein [Candidatus Bathyarchaeota archaeon]